LRNARPRKIRFAVPKQKWELPPMEFRFGAMLVVGSIVSATCYFIAPRASATDFADPADILSYQQSQKASHAGLPELAGSIASISSAKPAWYAISLALADGRKLNIIVAPATKFFKDYTPLDSPSACRLLVQGCKIRALHNPENDQLLGNIVITDLMFETPPVEFAATIKSAASPHPGVYDLAVKVEKGEERRFNLDEKTKYYQNYQPIDPAKAYPQLIAGKKVRAIEKVGPGGQRRISDLMFSEP
jgi:hypothetical protein